MSEGIPYADIFILALIAGFILLRLRSVLGQKSDEDTQGFFKPQAPVALKPAEPIVQLGDKSLKAKLKDEADPYVLSLEDKTIADSLISIKVKDPLFSATSFLTGAKFAFEMVFDAFAKGDKSTLERLLSPQRYSEFNQEIDARASEKNHSETTLLSVSAKSITHAALDKNTARITVQFGSEQVTVVRDADGKIIEGNASQGHHADDQWTFERDVTSKNPNWKIIET